MGSENILFQTRLVLTRLRPKKQQVLSLTLRVRGFVYECAVSFQNAHALGILSKMIVLFTLLLVSISSAVCLDLDYQRPPTSKDLALHHPRLQLSSRDPHYPDQIHLALAGPGRLAVSWVTWPSVSFVSSQWWQKLQVFIEKALGQCFVALSERIVAAQHVQCCMSSFGRQRSLHMQRDIL